MRRQPFSPETCIGCMQNTRKKRDGEQRVLGSNPTGLGGFKEIIFSVEGEKVYKNLKYESGVHRVQRVPKTEASGRYPIPQRFSRGSARSRGSGYRDKTGGSENRRVQVFRSRRTVSKYDGLSSADNSFAY